MALVQNFLSFLLFIAVSIAYAYAWAYVARMFATTLCTLFH